ncbi:MAG: chloramphenicol acetyltransferase [Candidatus Izemoplasmatales bacterium]|nr:chloramphenicol acetyltransferase [Candidatus Izemoplasmatales bacterium]
MKDIDIYKWKRIKHYQYYKGFDNPCFSINVNIDITLLISYIRENKMSFFPVFMYCLMTGINNIEEFRYRVINDRVVLFDQVDPSYTVLNEDESFVFCNTVYNSDFKLFCNNVIKDIQIAKSGSNLKDESGFEKYIFISSVPWFSFTGLTHPFKKEDNHSIPRVTFGKFFEQNGLYLLPVSIQAHHGLLDGIHIAKLLDNIQQIIKSL